MDHIQDVHLDLVDRLQRHTATVEGLRRRIQDVISDRQLGENVSMRPWSAMP
jgi:hypothetical protein